MERIAVIGSPGTGKSTFARQLATKTGLPLVHLDYYYNDAAYGFESNKEAWKLKAQELASADNWIIDGNYSSTLAERLQLADTVFYFDLPTYIAIKGIITRWLHGKNTKRLDMPDNWQEKPSWDFFWYVLRFRHNHASGTRQLLEQLEEKNNHYF